MIHQASQMSKEEAAYCDNVIKQCVDTGKYGVYTRYFHKQQQYTSYSCTFCTVAVPTWSSQRHMHYAYVSTNHRVFFCSVDCLQKMTARLLKSPQLGLHPAGARIEGRATNSRVAPTATSITTRRYGSTQGVTATGRAKQGLLTQQDPTSGFRLTAMPQTLPAQLSSPPYSRKNSVDLTQVPGTDLPVQPPTLKRKHSQASIQHRTPSSDDVKQQKKPISATFRGSRRSSKTTVMPWSSSSTELDWTSFNAVNAKLNDVGGVGATMFY